eukprot:2514127-Rhodomonas_salina.1
MRKQNIKKIVKYCCVAARTGKNREFCKPPPSSERMHGPSRLELLPLSVEALLLLLRLLHADGCFLRRGRLRISKRIAQS